MSAGGVCTIHFIDGIMKAMKYIEVLKENLSASTEKLGIGETFSFY